MNRPAPINTTPAFPFAHNTFRVRVPQMILDTIGLNNFPDVVQQALQDLRDEILTGYIQPLPETAPDTDFWAESAAPHLGRSWLNVPWFWAETYYYRRLLAATGYFQPGPLYHYDPFTPQKQAEWQADAAPAALLTHLTRLPTEPEARLLALLHGSLWGNRTDLSYNVAEHLGDTTGNDLDNLLVDDSAVFGAWLHQTRPRQLLWVGDNAGTELLMDLALIDHLLTQNWVEQIYLHLKAQPFFVSDTMPVDFEHAWQVLTASAAPAAELAGRIRQHRAEDRLRLDTHWAYTSSLFYFEMPADLMAMFAAADIVLTKGDANYRRLVGDAPWPPETPFAEATAYFPSPLLALRTLKAETVVGLPPGQADQLAAEDATWLTNGKRGVIQFSAGDGQQH